ncbi:MAG: dolichol-phosphate mannosyltransferase [Verrucomicrobiota bacterium]|jgi:dolichol-phosphate mannosyltransferase
MSPAAESLSIIIPTRNEAENIAALVSDIVATGASFCEILFVDGDSTDDTRNIIRSLAGDHAVRLIEQDPAERGLAAAIMAGAREAKGDLLLVMDADLSHPVDRIADLLIPLQTGTADMVIGSRYLKGGSTPNWPLWRRMLSRTASGVAYPLTKVHDSMAGFFAIPRRRLMEIAPPTIGFKIVFETIIRGGPGLRVREIPIAFHDRASGKSKMSFGVAVRFLYRWLVAVFRRALRLTAR